MVCSSIVFAKECSKEETLKFIDAGYTKEEINNICNTVSDQQFASKKQVVHQKDSDIEPWYFKFGLGYVGIKYSSELQNEVETIENVDGVSRSSIAIDFGFYFLIDNNSIAGFNINSISDTFEREGKEFTIDSYNYALSYMYFPKKVRDGFYFRGDLGISKGVVDGDGVSKYTTDNGLGYGIGLGYSFELGGTGLMLEIFRGSYELDDQKINSTQILLTALF